VVVSGIAGVYGRRDSRAGTGIPAQAAGFPAQGSS
jgi:hypothetical protein